MLETATPETEPNRLDAMIDILAEPPRYRPISTREMSLKNCEPPERISSWPKKTKVMTTVVPTTIASPSKALVSSAR